MAAPATEGVGAPADTLISTPDRRLRVFISSTMEELAAERRAVRDAITRLRLTPVLFELGARPHPPRDLYRAYLTQSDVFVGVYGERYGWVAPTMDISGLEDEFNLSAGMPRLMYVRRDAPGREPRLSALIERIWSEGGVSTTPYRDPEHLAELVSDDLAVLLTERFAAPVRHPPGLAAGWLPTPPAPLVDRRDELAMVTGLLRDQTVRMVTLTGPGGMGKTRLALAAAEAMVPDRDGVWWVDLAPVRDPEQVPATVSGVLGVTPEGRRPLLELVGDRLSGRRALLVLDNVEQVLGAAPDLAALLTRCPGTQLLVTSRTLLGLRGEQDVPLEPLAMPSPGERAVDRVLSSPAVQLFEARARRADPGFDVTDATAGAVAEVVRRLDGLPLAIELAAARVRTLPPTMLLRRLDRALDLTGSDVDAPDRQRTLRATVAWSYDLLGEPERALLARLSVCADGCALDTAEAVGSVDGDVDVLESLSVLVGHSLVTSRAGGEGEPRFRMLELVRAFAAERLRERGEEDATRERLAEHLATISALAGAGLSGPEHRFWRVRLDAETVDLQVALHWAIAHDEAELAVRIAAPLARWWWARGLLAPMAESAERTAALPSAAALPPDLAGLLRWARGATRVAHGSIEEAAPFIAEVVADARARDDAWLLGHGLVMLGMTRPPEDPEQPALLAEAVDALRRSGDDWSVAYALVPLGNVALLSGDLPKAARTHEEALGLARGIGDEHLMATLLDQLGLDALLADDLTGAQERLVESAGLHREIRDQEGLAYCLDLLAALALGRRDARTAARLIGAADAARAELGVVIWPLLQPLADQLDATVRRVLGEDDDRRERSAGAAAGPWTTLEQGLAAVTGRLETSSS
ncbi:ATP-binding protein [Petropleomorpha daqingensis]|uniref:Putative ATPase n=1 Tax=Petropleomorpha daqingensis TaxID=2026353 RepID=A0A853CD17_9ACTN|nr:putative ATPase [Petropleomorpha daqingensis]